MIQQALYIPGLLIRPNDWKCRRINQELEGYNIQLHCVDFSPMYQTGCDPNYPGMRQHVHQLLVQRHYDIVITHCTGGDHYLSAIRQDPSLEAEKNIMLIPTGDFSESLAMQLLSLRKTERTPFPNKYYGDDYKLPKQVFEEIARSTKENLSSFLHNSSLAIHASRDILASKSRDQNLVDIGVKEQCTVTDERDLKGTMDKVAETAARFLLQNQLR